MFASGQVVIIGGGQAASSAAAKLRGEGFDGSIFIVCDEPMLPYQRPPLSKKFLLGEMTKDQMLLRPQEFYDDHGIQVLLGVRATNIDRSSNMVVLEDGRKLPFSKLLIATGATPRKISNAKNDLLERMFAIRDFSDIEAVIPFFSPDKRVLIVGGGYIGLEAAAVARQLGLQTTLVEASPRILQRVASAETADLFRVLHQNWGVHLLENTSVENISLSTGKTYDIGLSDGSDLSVDFIITGIGVVPNVGLAEDSGLLIDNGIAVDQFGRTSDPNIFAAGDCASFPWRGNRIRLESVPNAIEQAENAACNILGKEISYAPVPWFWSDQYDVKLQIAGLNSGYDRTVVRPGVRERSKSVWYFRANELLAVDAFNDAPAFMTAKKLLQSNLSPSPEAVEDTTRELKSILKELTE